MFIFIINSKGLTHYNTEKTKILCKITSMIAMFLFVKFKNVEYVFNKNHNMKQYTEYKTID